MTSFTVHCGIGYTHLIVVPAVHDCPRGCVGSAYWYCDNNMIKSIDYIGKRFGIGGLKLVLQRYTVDIALCEG